MLNIGFPQMETLERSIVHELKSSYHAKKTKEQTIATEKYISNMLKVIADHYQENNG